MLASVDARWNELQKLIENNTMDPGEVGVLQLVQVRHMWHCAVCVVVCMQPPFMLHVARCTSHLHGEE